MWRATGSGLAGPYLCTSPSAAAGTPLTGRSHRFHKGPMVSKSCPYSPAECRHVIAHSGSRECSTSDSNQESSFQTFPASTGTKAQRDSLFDLAMIASFRVAMASVAGWQAPERWMLGKPGESYRGLVKVARRLFAASPTQTTERIRNVLRLFPTQPQLLGNNKLSFELLGVLTPILFPFLVGPCKTEAWTTPTGEQIRSKVVIERCRFLEESGCKGMCVGLCQQPTVQFFNQDLGLRMSMVPNFDTGGCELTWGMEPSTGLEASQDLRCYTGCGLLESPEQAIAQGSHSTPVRGGRARTGTCHLLHQWDVGKDYITY